jgi:SAM-dependent methyltransferase/uncharacterized protein YndB with AHSA1/START domain
VLTHRGGCHCGAVAFEVEAPAQLEVVECNCSICGPIAYQHLIVPRERFRLLRGEDMLASYRFGTRTARHLFCRTCGVKSFYLPRSHPDGVSVNVRSLAPGTVAGIRVRPFDGANWEEHRHELDPEPAATPAPQAGLAAASPAPEEGLPAAGAAPQSAPAPAGVVREIGLPQRSRAGSLEAVLEVAAALPRGRALDVPCGPGAASEALRRLGFQVTAADLDSKAFAGSREIRFETLDLDLPLPFADASYELVHCGDGIEHLENPLRALRELARVLAPNGSLILTTPNYASLERRLRFLLSGSLAKPLPRTPNGAARGEHGHGHLSPLTLTQIGWMAEQAGLELVSARTLLPARRQRWLAPLALPALLYRALLSAERRRDLFAEQSGSLDVLLGGRKLLLVFARGSAWAGAAAASASLRGMQQVDVMRRFDAPPEQVWKIYTDHAGWSSWAGLGRARLATEGHPDRNGVGAVRCFTNAGISVYEEVLSFEPPKRMTYRVVRGGIPIMTNHLGEVRLEPDGAGTRLTWRCRFDSSVPGLGPPMRWMVTRLFRRALEGLARRGFTA